MVKKRSLLDQMRANPRNDWTMADVDRLCREVGLVLLPPTGGSHYKVHGDGIPYILTIPAHRPIKPVYIRELVALADAALARRRPEESNDD